MNGKLILDSVSCKERHFIEFKPDGNFNAAEWEGGLADKSEYKDSLSITVGRCAIL